MRCIHSSLCIRVQRWSYASQLVPRRCYLEVFALLQPRGEGIAYSVSNQVKGEPSEENRQVREDSSPSPGMKCIISKTTSITPSSGGIGSSRR